MERWKESNKKNGAADVSICKSLRAVYGQQLARGPGQQVRDLFTI